MGFPAILDRFAPLLRNERSTLVTEFMNWRESHFLPSANHEVQRVVSGAESFCDRALRFSTDFPSPEMPFSTMLNCFFFRELLHRVDCAAAKSTLSCDLQTLQSQIYQVLAAGQLHLQGWEEVGMLHLLKKFGPMCQEILLAGWGIARQSSLNILFPPPYSATDSLWTSGHERTVEWAIPRCYHEACDASTDLSMRCAGCQRAWYCSVDCQRAAWPIHKLFCKGELQCGKSEKK